jgi:hypothetical protein
MRRAPVILTVVLLLPIGTMAQKDWGYWGTAEWGDNREISDFEEVLMH